MALERRNGRYYYYTKRRIGRRVVSTYEGSGERALLARQRTELYRELDARERAQDQAELARWREQAAATDQLMAELAITTAALTRAVLQASGYHQHKGQWRRKRGENKL